MKKFKFIISALFGLMLVASIPACTDHFDELNTSPTLVGADVVNPAQMFTRSVRNGVYQVPDYSGFAGAISGHYISPASGNIFLLNVYPSPFNMYNNQIIDIAETIRLTEAEEWYANLNAMSRIWKVWLFQQITDHYGDIPYFEAALAQNETVPFPAYDTQREIYVDMMEQLRQAASDLQDSADRLDVGQQDLIYNGNVEMWRRFANSLRLRYALRVRFADEQLAAQHISEVINAPLIEDNSQNAYVMTLPDGTQFNSNRHPVFNQNVNPLNPLTCAHTRVSNMRAAQSEDLDMDDPRLPVLCTPSPTDGEYRGRLLGGREGYGWFNGNNNISRLGPKALQSDQPINLMTYAEVEFNKAEIYLAGLASGDAQSAYQAGLRSALEFSFWELDEADISAFMASSAGSLSGDNEVQLRKISTQRFLALYNQVAESYSEFRRTGYPTTYLDAAEEGVTNRQIPRRFTYPTSEYEVNTQNVQQAAGRLDSGDNLMSRIWWDARPGLPIEHPHTGIYPPPPDQDITQEEFEQQFN